MVWFLREGDRKAGAYSTSIRAAQLLFNATRIPAPGGGPSRTVAQPGRFRPTFAFRHDRQWYGFLLLYPRRKISIGCMEFRLTIG